MSENEWKVINKHKVFSKHLIQLKLSFEINILNYIIPCTPSVWCGEHSAGI